MLKPLVIFDLDGTLNWSEHHCIKAQREAMAKFGAAQLPTETLLSQIGAPPLEYANVLVPNLSGDELQAFFKYALELDQKYVRECGRSYDGIPEALDTLRRSGMMTAVCSNSSEAYITAVLEGIGISELIDHVRPIIKPYGKKYSLGKLLESVPNCGAVMVGDTQYDSEAARDNGIPFIGCLYGYGRGDMEREKYKVESAYELPDMVEKVTGFKIIR